MALRQITKGIFLALVVGLGSCQASIADLTASTPACALACVLTAVQNGNCSLSSVTSLADCLCTNYNLQADLSKCTQQSCSFDEVVKAGAARTELCQTYPKESKANSVRIVAILAVALTTPVVILRLVARFKVSGKLWSDDWTAIVALVLLIGGAGLQLASAQLGFGKHIWDVDPTNAPTLYQLFFALEIDYTWVKVMAKISILLLYRRVFTATWFRWAVDINLGYFTCILIVWTFVLTFQCLPINSIWEKTIQGKCLDVNAIGYVGAVMSVVEDVILIVLPFPELRKLQVNTRKRIALGFLFTIASFATITSIIRVKSLIDFSTTYDSSYDNVDAADWSFIELLCTIVCGSLPPLRPWFSKLMPKLGTTYGTGKQAGGGVYGSKNLCSTGRRSVANILNSNTHTRDRPVTRDHKRSASQSFSYPLSPTPMNSAAPGPRERWEEWEEQAVSPFPMRDGTVPPLPGNPSEPHAMSHDVERGIPEMKRQPSTDMGESETDPIIHNPSPYGVQITQEIQVLSEPRRQSIDQMASSHSVRVLSTYDEKKGTPRSPPSRKASISSNLNLHRSKAG